MQTRTEQHRWWRRGGSRTGLIVLLGIFVGFVGLRLYLGRSAPVPPAFDPEVSMNDALNEAGSEKVVLVLATADWCPPCQQLKRGALADSRVIEAIRSRTVPVYADGTQQLGAEFAPLQIGAFPTMVAIRDGVVLSRVVGVLDAGEVLDWLDEVEQMPAAG